MAGPVGWCSPDNHTCNFMSHPFVETVCGNQAPSKSQRIGERGFRARCFRPRVEHPRCDRGVFRPRWNQSPADQRQFSDWFLWILANDRDRLGRGDVVTGTPVVFTRDAVEILFDNLLSPRKSVASIQKIPLAIPLGHPLCVRTLLPCPSCGTTDLTDNLGHN